MERPHIILVQEHCLTSDNISKFDKYFNDYCWFGLRWHGGVCSNTDTYVEPLDSTRIHPETYDWARKMAVDALEYDDTAEDANPAGALEEILDSPDRLKDLDLDAFAVELERQVDCTVVVSYSQWTDTTKKL